MKKRRSLPKFPHQFFYFSGMRFRQFLLRLSDLFSQPNMTVYEKAQGFWTSRAIVVACELDIADLLAGGPLSVVELSRLSGSEEDHLYRLLRMLASEGIFTERPGKIFENNRLSKPLIGGEGSVKNLILHQFSETNLTLFSEFKEVIRSGESYTRKLFGKPIFQFLEENPGKNAIYNQAMDDSSSLIALAILSAYSFRGVKKMVDVGGGHGIVLSCILQQHRNLTGILLDQPHVVEKAREITGAFGLGDRLQIVPGNFFEDIPAGADTYFMKNILHAFNDEDCIALLGKLRDAMLPHGRLVIVDTVIGPGYRSVFGKRLDLLMMTGTEGGKERTREEFERLLSGSGFRLKRVIRTVAPFSIIEAIKI